MRSPPPLLFDAPDRAQTPAKPSTDELRQRIRSAIGDFIRQRREGKLAEVYERRRGRMVRR
jgi:hypothetical protein